MSVKSKEVLTTTGKIRAALADALDRVSRGELPAADGKVMIGLANQITTNMGMEIKYQNLQSALGNTVSTMGALEIGDGDDNTTR